MGREIVRWKVDPLVERSRRGLDERILMAAPRLQRLLVAQARRRPPGSRLRRAVITRGLQVGLAAANRGDYESAVELPYTGITSCTCGPTTASGRGSRTPVSRPRWVRTRRAARGRSPSLSTAGNRAKSSIPAVPGSAFGTRLVGRGLESGVEVRQEEFLVWEVEDGMIRRLWGALATEDAMFRLLSQ